MRSLGERPNRIGAWLQPVRDFDGSISLGTWPVVPLSTSPAVLVDHALAALKHDAASEEGWLLLEAVYGSDALAGDTAIRYREVTADADLTAILPALGRAAPVAAARLAREVNGLGDVERRDRLREVLLALASNGPALTPSGASEARPVTPPTGHEALTDLQHAILGTLYLLAQAEPSPVDAMRRFATDLARLASADATYPRQIGTVVERLMRERPLAEAQACLDLLIETRSV